MSKEAITAGFEGVVFGREYRIRALMAGYTFIDWREMLFSGRIKSLDVRVAGATLDTRSAESRGAIPPNAGSLLNASSRFIPEGTWLGKYSSFNVFSATCSDGFKLAVAANTIDGF